MVVGERVGAVLQANTATMTITFLGFGVYEGNHPMEGAAGRAAQIFSGKPNPRIRLDSGKIVWGAECWWSSEADMIARLQFYKDKGWTQEDADIDDIRAQWLDANPLPEVES